MSQGTEFEELKQAYVALKAKHEGLLADYIALSKKANALQRDAEQHSTKGWWVANPYADAPNPRQEGLTPYWRAQLRGL